MKIYKIASPLDPNAYSYESNPARQKQHLEWSRMPLYPGDSTIVHQKQDKEQIKNNYFGVHLSSSKERAAAYAMIKGTREDPPVVICLRRESEDKEETDVDANTVIDSISTWIHEINRTITGKKTYNSITNALQKASERFEYTSSEDPDIHSNLSIVNMPQEILKYIEDFSETDVVNIWTQLASGVIPKKLIIIIADQFREMEPIFDNRVVSIEQLELINPSPNDMAYSILREGDEEEIEEMLNDTEYTISNGILYDSEGRRILDNESIESNWWMKVKKVIYQSKNIIPESQFVYHGTSLNRAKMAYPDLIK